MSLSRNIRRCLETCDPKQSWLVTNMNGKWIKFPRSTVWKYEYKIHVSLFVPFGVDVPGYFLPALSECMTKVELWTARASVESLACYVKTWLKMMCVKFEHRAHITSQFPNSNFSCYRVCCFTERTLYFGGKISHKYCTIHISLALSHKSPMFSHWLYVKSRRISMTIFHFQPHNLTIWGRQMLSKTLQTTYSITTPLSGH
jgi:hypothetical protein